MTKQEEIREEIHDIIGNCLIEIGCGGGGCPKAEIQQEEAQERCLTGILSYLHSQGVVIQVERELPKCSECCGEKLVYGEPENWKTLHLCPTCYGMGGYVAVEPLIKEEENAISSS